MIDLILNDKKYEFPERWAELTLGKYQDAMLLVNIEDKVDLTVKLLATLAGIPENELLDLPFTAFNKIKGVVDTLLKLKEDKLVFIQTIDGVEYGMFNKISELTAREFFDLDILVNDNDNVVQNLHLIMGILYRKIIKKNKDGTYEIEKYDSDLLMDRAELFKNKMTCDVVFAALSFSIALVASFTQYTKDYSEAEVVKKRREHESNKKNPSKKDGAGN